LSSSQGYRRASAITHGSSVAPFAPLAIRFDPSITASHQHGKRQWIQPTGASMTKPVSALRQRMIDDMTIRNMSPNTQKA
jgi:hypothetical protein